MNTKWMPCAAGILNIISGALSLIASLAAAWIIAVFFSPSYDSLSGQEFSAVVIWIVFILPLLIFSLLALIGGIFALRKKVWGLALAGSIASILLGWAFALGVTSVIFIALSKNEFNHPRYMFPASVIPPPSTPDQSSP
jgi:hypothetical protein